MRRTRRPPLFPPSFRYRSRRDSSNTASLAPPSPAAARRNKFVAKFSKRRLEEPGARSGEAAAFFFHEGASRASGQHLLLRGRKKSCRASSLLQPQGIRARPPFGTLASLEPCGAIDHGLPRRVVARARAERASERRSGGAKRVGSSDEIIDVERRGTPLQ